MLFSGLLQENNASKISDASPDEIVRDKSKSADEATLKIFEKGNKMVRGHLLNHMTSPLFDLFVTFKYVNIEVTSGANDTGKKKYAVGEWLHFHIIGDKPIMVQVHVYENLCVEVLSENLKMDEILQANVLIEKFPLC